MRLALASLSALFAVNRLTSFFRGLKDFRALNVPFLPFLPFINRRPRCYAALLLGEAAERNFDHPSRPPLS